MNQCVRQVGLYAICLAMGSLLPTDPVNAQAPRAGQTSEGLIVRPRQTPWTTSRLTGSPYPPHPYRLRQVFSQLTFTNPVALTAGGSRMWVAELAGKIFSFPLSKGQDATADLAIDVPAAIKGAERIYDITFDPAFETNGYCYITYVMAANQPDGTHVSRFKVQGSPPTIDPASEKLIVTWRSGGHNGGCLRFGPDGYLYISTGDAGAAFPPDGLKSGQDVTNLLSAVLRIDVHRSEKGRAYAIPADNPLRAVPEARQEIWAYGFRNPWKMSFDAETKSLWVGDVGWEMWELIHRVQPGGNYGWSLFEGSQPVHSERRRGPTEVLPPTIAHAHTEARSITGGHVYRGRQLPELRGSYIYGDYVTGKIWAASHDDQRVTAVREIAESGEQIICFGVDQENELYVVGYGGKIYQLASNETRQRNAANQQFPKRLSATGLFASTAKMQPAKGVVSYSINAEPWEDGAVAERWIALPHASQLSKQTENNVQRGMVRNDWKYPKDAVLAKTISVEMEAGKRQSRRRLETQILHFDGTSWQPYSYHWNKEQTDAILFEGEPEERSYSIVDPASANGHRSWTWRFATRSECLVCHTSRSGFVQGFHPYQLASPGGSKSKPKSTSAAKPKDPTAAKSDQLRTLGERGLFAEDIPTSRRQPLVNPHDQSQPISTRGRSYLHANCAHCHRRGGGGTAAFDIRYEYSLEKTNILKQRPTQGTFGIHNAEVVGGGDPRRSVLYYRMAKLGRGRMPHLGSREVDYEGLRLIREWIISLRPTDIEPVGHDWEKWLLSIDSPQQLSPKIAASLTTPGDALQFLNWLVRQDAVKRQKLAEAAARHPQATIRDLFEGLLPSSRRTQRLGQDIQLKEILAIKGDAKAGRRAFLKAPDMQCRNCHRLEGTGRQVGPDLSDVGTKYATSRQRLLESIVQPSRAIDPKYQTYLIETKAGRVLSGLIRQQNKQQLTLLDASGRETKIERDAIERSLPLQKSLMPELLTRDMSAQQLADLLAFLHSLRAHR